MFFPDWVVWLKEIKKERNKRKRDRKIMVSYLQSFGTISRHFCPNQLTVIHTCIQTLMAVAAMQGADQHIRSSLGFSILPKDTLALTTLKCRPGKSNQRPSNNKTLALPLNHSDSDAMSMNLSGAEFLHIAPFKYCKRASVQG